MFPLKQDFDKCSHMSDRPLIKITGTFSSRHHHEEETPARKRENLALVLKTTLIAEEKQRKELGAELHDNVNQILAVTKLYIQLGIDYEDQRMEMLVKCHDHVSQAMNEIRLLTQKLTGTAVTEDLQHSLAELVRSVQDVVPFNMTLCIDPEAEELLSIPRKLMFHRIVQEQLNNIIKYAAPTNVLISISRSGTFIQLIIQDDGTGFDTSLPAAGIGLKNMQRRVETENGTCSIVSSKCKGCCVTVQVGV